MFRSLVLVVAIVLFAGVLAESAEARNRRNPNYYGTPRHASARVYSGAYQAFRPNNVRTFTLPAGRSGGFYAPYVGYGRRGFYPVYQQPVILYPPRVTYGFGF